MWAPVTVRYPNFCTVPSIEDHPRCLMTLHLRLLQRLVIMLSLLRSGHGFIATTTCRTATVTKGVGRAKGALSRCLLLGQQGNIASGTFGFRRTTLPGAADAPLYNAAGNGLLSSGVHGSGTFGVAVGRGRSEGGRLSGTRRLSVTAQTEAVSQRSNVVNPAARTTSTTLEQVCVFVGFGVRVDGRVAKCRWLLCASCW